MLQTERAHASPQQNTISMKHTQLYCIFYHLAQFSRSASIRAVNTSLLGIQISYNAIQEEAGLTPLKQKENARNQVDSTVRSRYMRIVYERNGSRVFHSSPCGPRFIHIELNQLSFMTRTHCGSAICFRPCRAFAPPPQHLG